jgi:hypothetical protein
LQKSVHAPDHRGHNLIGVLPDIQLDQPDDELRLLARLRAYRAEPSSPRRHSFTMQFLADDTTRSYFQFVTFHRLAQRLVDQRLIAPFARLRLEVFNQTGVQQHRHAAFARRGLRPSYVCQCTSER